MSDPCEHRHLRCLWEVVSHPMVRRTWEARVGFVCGDCGHPFQPKLRFQLQPEAESWQVEQRLSRTCPACGTVTRYRPENLPPKYCFHCSEKLESNEG